MEVLVVDTVVVLLEPTLLFHAELSVDVSLAVKVALLRKDSTLAQLVEEAANLAVHQFLIRAMASIQTKEEALKANLNLKSRMGQVCLTSSPTPNHTCKL